MVPDGARHPFLCFSISAVLRAQRLQTARASTRASPDNDDQNP